MKLTTTHEMMQARRSEASVLIIVLWISVGLVSIALYFANSMNYELQAADNREDGTIADQAIEGAARYVSYELFLYATNGMVPDNTQFHCEAVAVGDAKFWLIGRDPNQVSYTDTDPYWGLVDEGGRINLNNISTNVLQYLPNMTYDFSEAIQDWRGTNSPQPLDYSSAGYSAKNAPFETVDELNLVQGATQDLLVGEDLNRNGVLDPSEKDENGNGELDPGLFEYTTVYTREPNFHADGTTMTNVNSVTETQLQDLFQAEGTASASSMAQSLYRGIHGSTTASATTVVNACKGALDLCLRLKNAGMSSDDFTKISDFVTTSTNTYFRGRVNINTACVNVLVALFMGLNVDESTATSAAQQLVQYRQQNTQNLGSVAWFVDALGNNSPVVTAMANGGDYITSRSYQFTADIAAVGPYGRGYRRVRFVFDVSDGSPKIIYRQDQSRLGWALGDKVRQSLAVNDVQ